MKYNSESKLEMEETVNKSMLKIYSITVLNGNIVYTLYNVEKETDRFLEINMIDESDRTSIATKINDFLNMKGQKPRKKIREELREIVDSLSKNDSNPVMSLGVLKYFGNWATNADVRQGHRRQSPLASKIMHQILGFEITQKDIGSKTASEPDFRSGYEIFHNISNKIHDRQLKSPAPFPPRASTGTVPTAASLCLA